MKFTTCVNQKDISTRTCTQNSCCNKNICLETEKERHEKVLYLLYTWLEIHWQYYLTWMNFEACKSWLPVNTHSSLSFLVHPYLQDNLPRKIFAHLCKYFIFNLLCFSLDHLTAEVCHLVIDVQIVSHDLSHLTIFYVCIFLVPQMHFSHLIGCLIIVPEGYRKGLCLSVLPMTLKNKKFPVSSTSVLITLYDPVLLITWTHKSLGFSHIWFCILKHFWCHWATQVKFCFFKFTAILAGFPQTVSKLQKLLILRRLFNNLLD